jgi:ATP-dependent exoDNAse (exonuclease V) beta subunit
MNPMNPMTLTNLTNSNTHLSAINPHERDALIKFYQTGHRYEILCDVDSQYTSVTTWIHTHFPKFNADDIIQKMFKSKNWNSKNKYWGMTADEIKNMWKKSGDDSCSFGTNLHEQIETFMNNTTLPRHYTLGDLLSLYNERLPENMSTEWSYFVEFLKDNLDLKPYRTEWMIFDEELKIAGSIDMVFENPDGTLSIYDWKRCKEINKNNNWNKYSTNELISHLPDTNYWHYSLQLNTYKAILERKYGKQIKDLFLVRMHPDSLSMTYELIQVPTLTDEITNLFDERIRQL